MNTQNTSKTFNYGLWTAQIFLTLFFFSAGAIKLFIPIENTYSLLSWTKDFSSETVRLIGFSEILGSIGLMVLIILRIKKQLTPWTAVVIALIMLLAIVFNNLIGKTSVIALNVLLFCIALVFAAWGRFKKSHSSPKQIENENILSQN